MLKKLKLLTKFAQRLLNTFRKPKPYSATMSFPFVILDDSGCHHVHSGRYFKTAKDASNFLLTHDLQCNFLIYNLAKAPTVNFNPDSIAKQLEDMAASEIAAAEHTEKVIAECLEEYGDDYDPWTEIMEDGNGYPDDNYGNAEIYEWMLSDHLANGTTVWTMEQLTDNTDMGTSGRDGWNDAWHHLNSIGLMRDKDFKPGAWL